MYFLQYCLDEIKEQLEQLKEIAEKTDITQMDVDRTIANHCDMNCDMCDTKFKSLPEAQYHYMHEHSISDGYIKCCNSIYKTIEKLKGHIFWHLHPGALK